MARIRSMLAAAALVFLAGCPLGSDAPLSDPGSAAIDAALLGTWDSAEPGNGDAYTLTLARFNEHELVGIGRESAAEGGEVSVFRLFVTAIGPARFLNITELTNEGGPQWYFARYVVDGSSLRLRIIDDALFDTEPSLSSGELRAFVGRHLDDDALYGGTERDAPPTVLQRRERAAGAPALNPTF